MFWGGEGQGRGWNWGEREWDWHSPILLNPVSVSSQTQSSFRLHWQNSWHRLEEPDCGPDTLTQGKGIKIGGASEIRVGSYSPQHWIWHQKASTEPCTSLTISWMVMSITAHLWPSLIGARGLHSPNRLLCPTYCSLHILVQQLKFWRSHIH